MQKLRIVLMRSFSCAKRGKAMEKVKSPRWKWVLLIFLTGIVPFATFGPFSQRARAQAIFDAATDFERVELAVIYWAGRSVITNDIDTIKGINPFYRLHGGLRLGEPRTIVRQATKRIGQIYFMEGMNEVIIVGFYAFELDFFKQSYSMLHLADHAVEIDGWKVLGLVRGLYLVGFFESHEVLRSVIP